MVTPQAERNKKITEMASVVRIFAVLIIAAALLSVAPVVRVFSFLGRLSTIEVLSIQLITILVVLFGSTFGLEKIRMHAAALLGKGSFAEPFLMDYITLGSSVFLLGLVIHFSGGTVDYLRIIFLPTILFYTMRFGQKWGLAAATLSAFALVLLGLYSSPGASALPQFGLEIVFIGVFFLTTWLVGSIVDLERAISDRLSSEILIDDLTGVYNHRHFQEELARRISTVALSGNGVPPARFGLILADLDYFKHYNETFGYPAGDSLLKKIARCVTTSIGGAGIVFRFGSDEFAVILDGAGRGETMRTAIKLRSDIGRCETQSFTDKHWKFDLTASFGVVVYPDDAANREKLLQRLDEALYKAKVISGNKVEAYFSILEQIKTEAGSSEKEILDRMHTFLAIINARDRYTFGHSERVLVYASILGSLAGLSATEKKQLQYGAYLHDIGKIEIDRSVLNKPGTLTGAEWELLKKHPLWGAEIIRQVKMLQPAEAIILYHHERYDGQGYPFGIRGENIPLAARIMTVVDAFDAMTVERPYRKAFTLDQAWDELQQHSGSQFDPDLVALFVPFLQEHQTIEKILSSEIRKIYL